MRTGVVLRSVLKASLPFRRQLRWAKRMVRPYQDNAADSRYTLQQGLQIIRLLRASGANVGGDVLELGTGWLPIIPLLFHIAGARRLILTDLERLMDAQTTARARKLILENLPEVTGALGLSEPQVERSLADDFAPRYLAPWNSRAHPPLSADIIYSRAVLEHVPPSVIAQLLTDFQRILRPNGAMVHVVDNSDHWEHQDKSLSRVDFLRYEESAHWKMATWDPQDYQNRLRHSDYLHLFADHGWAVAHAEGLPDEKCLQDLENIPLAARFRGRDHRDLAVLTSTFLLRPRAALN